MGMITLRWGLPPRRSRASTIAAAAIASLGVFGAFWLFRELGWPFWPAAGGFAAYLVVAYVVLPAADRDQLGWLGGLVDIPFVWRDDAERGLLGLELLLWPGRFIGEAYVSLVRDFVHPARS